MKKKVKKIIFKLRLAPLFEILNFSREKMKKKKENINFREQNPDIALPPDFYIYETFSLDYKKYYDGGKETAQWVWNHLKDYINLKELSILDWGCGPGRVIRHLPAIIGDNNYYYGCDYNEKYVDWCHKNIGNVIFKKNELTPPLDFENDSLDIVYGISIFTHLSKEMHYSWMNELNRILKKSGILLLTTHGEVSKIKLSEREKEIFNSGNLVIHKYKKEGNRLFASYQPYEFFRSLCEKNNFKVIKHISGELINNKPLQDVWILLKK